MGTEHLDLKTSALRSFQRYVETGEECHSEEFVNSISAVCEHRDVDGALEIWEEVIPVAPDRAEAYLNAARFCDYWTWKLRDGYFDSKGVDYMRGEEWFSGKGTPWLHCMGLAMKAIEYYRKFIDLSPDLDPDFVTGIYGRIERLG